MKIAFWSNESERSGSFCNTAAISIASVMGYRYTITVLENYLERDNLGKAFFVNNDTNNKRYVGTGFYEGGGIEGLLRRIYRGDNNHYLLRGYLKEVIPKHLYYIPQNGLINSEVFDYELYYNLDALLNIIERNTDLCFINVTQQNHLSSKAILQEADLILINLYQDYEYLEDFFKNYHSFVSKALFLVGNYSSKSSISCKRISRLYDIPLKDILPIPRNEYFNVACNYGGAKEFLSTNYFCDRDNPNHFFIHGIRKATFIIKNRIEESFLLAKEG